MVKLVQCQEIMGSYSSLSRLSKFHTKAKSFLFQYPGNSKDWKTNIPWQLHNFWLLVSSLWSPITAYDSYTDLLTYCAKYAGKKAKETGVSFTAFVLKKELKNIVRTFVLHALIDFVDFATKDLFFHFVLQSKKCIECAASGKFRNVSLYFCSTWCLSILK